MSNKKPSNHNLFKNLFRNDSFHNSKSPSSSDRDSWASLPPLEEHGLPSEDEDEEEEKSETIKEPDYFGKKINPDAILIDSEYTLTESFTENFSLSDSDDSDSDDDEDTEDHPEILMYMNQK